MIRITNLKVPIMPDKEAQQAALEAAIRKELGISELHPLTYSLWHRSIDARRRDGNDKLHFIYTVDASAAKEDKLWKKGASRHKNWTRFDTAPAYAIHALSSGVLPSDRPVVVGFGPAGLFTALLLARAGLKPLIIERGKPVEARSIDTQKFFDSGILDTESNVQFGEGGAGTFSDGKVNSLVKDPSLRGHFVLNEFVKAGAPETILYDNKPHIGTDRLQQVVKNMREEILSLGGEVRFQTKLTGLELDENGHIKAIRIVSAAKNPDHHSDTDLTNNANFLIRSKDFDELIETRAVFLGIGHSARDTFEMLAAAGAHMEAKPFAMGVRIEHEQSMIDECQYHGFAGNPNLGAASYKLTHHAANDRSVYTFCMCPGGVVIASASEEGGVVVNGMSRYARDEVNSNAALLVNVTADDALNYLTEHCPELLEQENGRLLAGAYFQRLLEQKAFELGGSNYAAPIQLVGDFMSGTDAESEFGSIRPSFTGKVCRANLHDLLPTYMTEALADGVTAFGHKIPGFDRADAVLTAIESRSSSPVRIVRDETFQSNLRGLYPSGEGAGYAGGILSAAMDGMKVAEAYINSLNQ